MFGESVEININFPLFENSNLFQICSGKISISLIKNGILSKFFKLYNFNIPFYFVLPLLQLQYLVDHIQ